MGTQERNEEAESAARQALEVFMTAWNTGDNAKLRATMNFPFVTFGGGSRVFVNKTPEDFSQGFAEMRDSQNWAFSTFDSLEPSVIKANKVHWEVVFSRWHPDGTRYWTVPALWVTTKVDGHWGIQFRSLMPATFSNR